MSNATMVGVTLRSVMLFISWLAISKIVSFLRFVRCVYGCCSTTCVFDIHWIQYADTRAKPALLFHCVVQSLFGVKLKTHFSGPVTNCYKFVTELT